MNNIYVVRNNNKLSYQFNSIDDLLEYLSEEQFDEKFLVDVVTGLLQTFSFNYYGMSIERIIN